MIDYLLGKGVGKRMKDLLSDHIEKTSMSTNMDQKIRNTQKDLQCEQFLV
jgi:hypothetical protein